ncbi:odorant receptor 82a-like isoform X2 [Lasioglossum baleicum]|uniref:odorant receptor 82a-like isoform X2 n=1 Tax=Lasioglossum baleicum TaxID=434251 RepID=UPI003FCE17B7
MLQSSDAVEIRDALVYCQRIFAIGGVLPQQHTPKLFKLIMLYYFHLGAMQLWDCYDSLHDFQAILVNAMEMPVTVSLLFSLVLIRTNKKLILVVEHIQRDIKRTIISENVEEKRLYRKYNLISVYFGKYVSVLAFLVGYLIYVRPLIDLLIHPRTDVKNNTRPFKLPFRSHMPFDYHYNAKMYTLLYIYQFPVAFLAIYHAAEASLIVTSTLHVCARFSVLARRIRTSLTKSPEHFPKRMKMIVIEHLELTKLSGFLNDCFRHLLLIEYLNCSFRLGISMYVLVITLGKDTVASVNFFLYTMIVIAWLYLYSYIGEQLTYESQSIGDAFYDTDWTEIASRDRRSLVMCLINGQKAQNLMAGEFYKYTLFGFSDIVKTSLAFFSVLRRNVE